MATPTVFRLRTPRAEDLSAVVTLLREAELADFGTADTTEEMLRTAWRILDVERNAWLAVDEANRLLGYAALRARAPGHLRARVTVAPRERGRGVGSLLLGNVEARAREVAAGDEATLSQWIATADDAGRRLLEGHDYAEVRRFWEMEIALADEPAPPEWPDGIAVETLAAGGEREVFDALEEAFLDHWDFVPHDYEEWRAFNVERESFDPTLWFLARDGSELAGGSLCNVHEGRAWIDELGVRRRWRRRGIALALLRHSFRELRSRGFERARLGVDAESPTGATRLYERAGMRVVAEDITYRKELRPA